MSEFSFPFLLTPRILFWCGHESCLQVRTRRTAGAGRGAWWDMDAGQESVSSFAPRTSSSSVKPGSWARGPGCCQLIQALETLNSAFASFCLFPAGSIATVWEKWLDKIQFYQDWEEYCIWSESLMFQAHNQSPWLILALNSSGFPPCKLTSWIELTLWALSCPPNVLPPAPLNFSSSACIFKCLSLDLSDSGNAHPALPDWVSTRVRAEALSSAVIPRELEPRTVCVPRSAASPEAAGRDSRQASDKPWIRTTFPTPLITARLPPSVFLQSQSSQLVTRCLWYEAWSCESRTHWPSLSEVIRHWNP